jgi:hypothetical protein
MRKWFPFPLELLSRSILESRRFIRIGSIFYPCSMAISSHSSWPLWDSRCSLRLFVVRRRGLVGISPFLPWLGAVGSRIATHRSSTRRWSRVLPDAALFGREEGWRHGTLCVSPGWPSYICSTRITREGNVVILLTPIDIWLDVRSVVEMDSRHGDRLG